MFFEGLDATPGSIEECVICPGGAREALFSDSTYKLVWNNRTGFALEANDFDILFIKSYFKSIIYVD